MPSIMATFSPRRQPVAQTLAERLETAFVASGGVISLVECDGNWVVELYLEGDDIAVVENAILEAVSDPNLAADMTLSCLDDADWVAMSLEGLEPVRVGRFVVHGIHARDAVRDCDIGIRIEAGRAFGTGHHATTTGCLLALDEVFKRTGPQNILDLGTGSGVLAIAIAKRWKRHVLATDIDPIATRICRENAALNHVKPWIRACTATGFADRAIALRAPFDLVVANILAGPLAAMAPTLARHLAPRGIVILSGLLTHQERAVLAAYRAHNLIPVDKRRIGEWSTLVLTPGRT